MEKPRGCPGWHKGCLRAGSGVQPSRMLTAPSVWWIGSVLAQPLSRQCKGKAECGGFMKTLRCLPSPSAECAGPRSGVVAFRRGDAQRQKASHWGSHCEIPRAAHSLWALSRSHCRATGRGLGLQLGPPSSILYHCCAGRAQDASPAVCWEGARVGVHPAAGQGCSAGVGTPCGDSPRDPNVHGFKVTQAAPGKKCAFEMQSGSPPLQLSQAQMLS